MTIKVIHIGVGIRGSHWLQFVADHPDFQSVACVDADADAIARAKSQLGAECGFFDNVTQAIDETDVHEMRGE